MRTRFFLNRFFDPRQNYNCQNKLKIRSHPFRYKKTRVFNVIIFYFATLNLCRQKVNYRVLFLLLGVSSRFMGRKDHYHDGMYSAWIYPRRNLPCACFFDGAGMSTFVVDSSVIVVVVAVLFFFPSSPERDKQKKRKKNCEA